MGTYDTVLVECPKCKTITPVQSKAGGCNMREYTPDSVPFEIANSLRKFAIICEGCGAAIRLKSKKLRKNVGMKVKLAKENFDGAV